MNLAEHVNQALQELTNETPSEKASEEIESSPEAREETSQPATSFDAGILADPEKVRAFVANYAAMNGLRLMTSEAPPEKATAPEPEPEAPLDIAQIVENELSEIAPMLAPSIGQALAKIIPSLVERSTKSTAAKVQNLHENSVKAQLEATLTTFIEDTTNYPGFLQLGPKMQEIAQLLPAGKGVDQRTYIDYLYRLASDSPKKSATSRETTKPKVSTVKSDPTPTVVKGSQATNIRSSAEEALAELLRS